MIRADGAPRAHRLDPREVARTAELDLQQRPPGILRRLRPHRVGRVERQRVGRQLRTRRRRARRVPRPAARPAWPRDPRARSRRRCAPRPAAAGSATPAGRTPRQRFDLLRNAVGRLAVARIGHAFAASAQSARLDGDGQDMCLGPRAAADGEGAPEREGLACDDKAHQASASTSRATPWRTGSTAGRNSRPSMLPR